MENASMSKKILVSPMGKIQTLSKIEGVKRTFFYLFLVSHEVDAAVACGLFGPTKWIG
jgi:hypothetical protein